MSERPRIDRWIHEETVASANAARAAALRIAKAISRMEQGLTHENDRAMAAVHLQRALMGLEQVAGVIRYRSGGES